MYSGMGSSVSLVYMLLDPIVIRNLDNTGNAGLHLEDMTGPVSLIQDSAIGLINDVAINMNTGVITMVFSKPVDIASIKLSRFVIQNQRVVCGPPDCAVANG